MRYLRGTSEAHIFLQTLQNRARCDLRPFHELLTAWAGEAPTGIVRQHRLCVPVDLTYFVSRCFVSLTRAVVARDNVPGAEVRRGLCGWCRTTCTLSNLCAGHKRRPRKIQAPWSVSSRTQRAWHTREALL